MLNCDEIQVAIDRGEILITPYDAARLGTNSYDVTLAGSYLQYFPDVVLDPYEENPTRTCLMPITGVVLRPGDFLLSGICEGISLPGNDLIPKIDGVSSLARLGLSIHQTAGFGDIGFSGRWTLELSCLRPIRLYPGMRIAQVSFERCTPCSRRYQGRYREDRVSASRYWECA